MNKFNPIPKERREQILSRIKKDGVSVVQAAREHGVSDKTIYRWLSERSMENISFREYSILKKKNQQLLELVGKLTYKLNQTENFKKR
jgi:transposase-like protein